MSDDGGAIVKGRPAQRRLCLFVYCPQSVAVLLIGCTLVESESLVCLLRAVFG